MEETLLTKGQERRLTYIGELILAYVSRKDYVAKTYVYRWVDIPKHIIKKIEECLKEATEENNNVVDVRANQLAVLADVRGTLDNIHVVNTTRRVNINYIKLLLDDVVIEAADEEETTNPNAEK